MKNVILMALLVAAIGCGDESQNFSSTDYGVAGALRCTNSVCAVIDDEYHTPLNITGVYTREDYITVCYPEASEVVTFLVAPDEGAAFYGIFVGASVGTDCADIYFYRQVNGAMVRLTPEQLSVPGLNFWIHGVLR